jgi:hypothetical protein
VGINQFAFNNVGNPEVEGAIPFNTHEMEKELIHEWHLLNAKQLDLKKKKASSGDKVRVAKPPPTTEGASLLCILNAVQPHINSSVFAIMP